jgi:short-subunit dehydrogenase
MKTILPNSTVLITGASSGIGKSFALDFASRGANVILVARTEASLQSVADEITKQYKSKVTILAADLGKPNAAEQLFNTIQALNIEVNILVNNAAFGKWGKFEDFDLVTYNQMLQLNINALTEMCYLFLPAMRKNKTGGIINVASSAALMPVPYAAVYSASKSYVLYFSEALYGELLDTGVTVTCLCPSGTKTNFASVANADVVPDEKQYETPEHVARVGIEGFLQGENYVLSGKQKTMLTIVPRVLSRKAVIKMSAKAFKKVVDTKKS